MKIPLSVLKRFIDLPSGYQNPESLKVLLEDLVGEVKGVEDEVFNIETLANRGDHLSVLGIARELAARLMTTHKLPQLAANLSERGISLIVRRHTDLALRYALLEVQLGEGFSLRSDLETFIGKSKSLSSPGKEKPTSEKSAIVELVNYVQLELGQPMHVFDRDKIEGNEVHVTELPQEEKFLALDGVTYKVPAGAVVIRDKVKLLAVAGIIGGESSKATSNTNRILIESAIFDPKSIRRTRKSMGLFTDAAQRFERGGDPESVVTALRRLVHVGGLHTTGYSIFEGPVPGAVEIDLRLNLIREAMNLPRLAEVEILAALKGLGFKISELVKGDKGGAYRVSVPSHRIYDLRNEADLCEEVVRVLGLNRVKPTLRSIIPTAIFKDDAERLREKCVAVLQSSGFYEVISKAYYSEEVSRALSVLDPSSEPLRVKDSINTDLSSLKISNIFHLGEILHRGLQIYPSAKVFEIGKFFSPISLRKEEEIFERKVLSFAFAGSWSDLESDIHLGIGDGTFTDRALLFKGVVCQLFNSFKVPYVISNTKHPFLHPGASACIKIGSEKLGHFGLVHPQLIKTLFDSNMECFYCEVDLDQLLPLFLKVEDQEERNLQTSLKLTPIVRRDITVNIPLEMDSAKIRDLLAKVKIKELIDIKTYNNFKKPEEDFNRQTVRLLFQGEGRTLTKEEVDGWMETLNSALVGVLS